MTGRPTILSALIASLCLTSCAGTHETQRLQDENEALRARLEEFEQERELVAKNLAGYDELDLVAFNARDMKRLQELHTDDVVVYNPDGSVTKGMNPKHTEELQDYFDLFDMKIPEHPVGFGSGDWTAGIAKVHGRWVRAITLPDGTVLEPTGRSYEIKVATIARWEKGRIAEEYLFWDNADFNRQIGLPR